MTTWFKKPPLEEGFSRDMVSDARTGALRVSAHRGSTQRAEDHETREKYRARQKTRQHHCLKVADSNVRTELGGQDEEASRRGGDKEHEATGQQMQDEAS